MEIDYISPYAIVAKHQKAAPVNLAGIAHDLGLMVYESHLGSEVSGKIVKDSVRGGDSGYAVYINASDHLNRKRFTIAHEIAHFVLHRDLIEQGIVDNEMYRDKRISSHDETQANRMAADILMPVALVRHYKSQGYGLDQLAALFQVSQGAMKIRLDGMERRY